MIWYTALRNIIINGITHYSQIALKWWLSCISFKLTSVMCHIYMFKISNDEDIVVFWPSFLYLVKKYWIWTSAVKFEACVGWSVTWCILLYWISKVISADSTKRKKKIFKHYTTTRPCAIERRKDSGDGSPWVGVPRLPAVRGGCRYRLTDGGTQGPSTLETPASHEQPFSTGYWYFIL